MGATSGDGMKVGKWMKTELLLVSPSDSVRTAWGLLREHQIRHLPVVENGKLVGIVTDRDIRLVFPSAVTAGQREQDPHDVLERVSVGEIMTRQVVTVASEASMADAARLLLERRIGGLPVVMGDHLVGIITKDDILAAFIEVVEARYQ
jgi:acetoin utilization protein AcuB